MVRTLRSTRERGAALVLVTILGFTIFILVAVGIDLGHLALNATEVQTVAEAAATAGARALVDGNDALAAAQAVVSENAVNAVTASITPPELEVGNYDFSTQTFTPDALPSNAVRATPSDTVLNYMAGVFGRFSTTVTKQSTAVYTTIGSGNPTLPLALKDCEANCTSSSQCDLGDLNQVPSGNSFWTSVYACSDSTNPCPSVNKNSILAMIQQCSGCSGSGCGELADVGPRLSVGDTINLNNGQVTGDIFKAIACLLDSSPRIDTFLIPMIGCSGGSSEGTVKGFATIQVECVQAPDLDPAQQDVRCEDTARACTGGTNQGHSCQNDHDCPGVCDRGRCSGGNDSGRRCTKDNQCPGVCQAAGQCVGGSKNTHSCIDDADCPGGTCSTNAKYLNLHAIFNTGVPGTPGGCTGCGTGFIALVN